MKHWLNSSKKVTSLKGKKALEIKRELLELTTVVLKKYTLDCERKAKYFLAQPSKIFTRELKRLNTTALRRMRVKPNGRNPWKISFSRNLPFEVFDVLKVRCEKLTDSLIETKRRCKMTFTSDEKIHALMQHAKLVPTAKSPCSMCKLMKNKDYVALNCRQDLPFEIIYYNIDAI